MSSSGSAPVSGRADNFASGPHPAHPLGPVASSGVAAHAVAPSGAAAAAPIHPRANLAPLAPSPALPRVEPTRASGRHQPHVPWVTDWIDANRKLLFVIALLPYLLSFNGRWRIGLDSAL